MFYKMYPRLYVVPALGLLSAAGAASAIYDVGGHIHHVGCEHGTGAVRDGGGTAGGPNDFILNTTWFRTATDGNGINRGDAMTLTWGFVQDGSNWFDGAQSDLINFLDTRLGSGPGGSDLTQRPWFQSFEKSFDRWGQLSGLSYVYEANDDGSSLSNSIFNGQLGVRADVRIGGSVVDGNSGVLASNFFPTSGGDMRIDTGDVSFYSNTSGDSIRLRNVLMHEHGHGLGMSHVESNNAGFLMEPFIQTSFDGPQLDDIRALHRGYGDRLEKNGGNDSVAAATSLGDISDAAAAVGLDGNTGAQVSPDEVDFVSIDGSSDTDFFSFDVSGEAELDLVLTPLGTIYNQGPQNGSQSSFDTRDDNDLRLDLFGTDGSTLLASINNFGAGLAESLLDFVLPEAGTYFARVRGAFDTLQLYSLVADTELLGALLAGDADGDGDVDLADFTILRNNFGLEAGATFATGDFDGNGMVDLADFTILRNNFGADTGADVLDAWYAAVVPEPTTATLLALGGLTLLRRRR
jgi:hypothetical protein